MKVYGLLALAVVLVAALVYAGWQSHLADRFRAEYEAFKTKRSAVDVEAARVLGEVAAKDQAIIGLSRRIQDLSVAADAARARADQAETTGRAAASRAALLRAEIARLEAEAASRAAIGSRAGAIQALARFGYPRPALEPQKP